MFKKNKNITKKKNFTFLKKLIIPYVDCCKTIRGVYFIKGEQQCFLLKIKLYGKLSFTQSARQCEK